MLINLLKLFGLVLVATVLLAGVFFWDNIKGILPGVTKAPGDIAEIINNNNAGIPGDAENNTEFPLTIPDGFKIEIFAKDLENARVMAFDGNGDMWVSRSSSGIVTKLDIENNQVVGQQNLLTGLNRPHGLAFDYRDYSKLYVAEEGQIIRVDLSAGNTKQKIADLPTEGGGHSTRTIDFGPDDKLYVSIGSSCNVCEESDPRRAAIYSMNRDGSDFKQYASGLRNAVFFDWSELDGSMWATENSRDLIGDDIPPDELNVIKEGGNYGWPICYGQNIHDSAYDKKTYIRNPCMEPFETPAKVDLQAHSAALGLGFVPERLLWPEDYWYDLIVAYHGSWNRTEPTGYKLVRIKIDGQGNYQGTEDFISGWLTPEGVLGRPVDVKFSPNAELFVSDDKAGVIYKITPQE